jgi:hypothetical protein
MRRPKARRLKGQTWQVEEGSAVVLVLIIIAGVIVVIIAAWGGLSNVLYDFCQKNPEWCGGEVPDDDYTIAMRSMNALACAINTVAKGDFWTGTECSKFYAASSSDGGLGLPDTDDLFQGGSPGSPSGGSSGFIVSKDYSDFMTGLAADKTYSIKEIPSVRCSDDMKTCTLYNFNLPQIVSGPKDWIKGYGDPNFLLYWQSFPEGEDDAWDGMYIWMENAFDLFFAWWGAGKVMSVGKGAAKKTIFYGVKSGYYSLKSLKGKAIKDPLEYFIKVTLKGEGGEALGNTIAKEVGKDALEAFQKISRKEAKTIVKLGIPLTAVTAGAALIDSINAKYKSYPDSLVMKLPYEDPENQPLELDGEPVFLENKKTDFYMASPCSADLEVNRIVVECDEFAYNMFSDEVKCTNPDIEDYTDTINGIECGKDKSIERYFPGKDTTTLDIIKNLEGKEQFRILESDQTLSTITIRDPVDRVSFMLEKGMHEITITEYTEIGETQIDEVTDAWEIKKVIFENSDGTTKEYEVTDGKITDPEFEVDLGSKNKMNYLFKYAPIDIEIKPKSFDVDKSECANCKDYEETLSKVKSIRFERKSDEANKDNQEISYDTLLLKHGSGYNIVFMDIESKVREKTTDLASRDGIAEIIGIDTRSFTDILWTTFPDKVMLKDMDYDGIVDLVSTDEDCKIKGVSIKLIERKETGEDNFCFAQESFVRKGMRWTPEIGAVLGGAAGFLGGPFAELSVPAGAVIGSRIGAAVFTVYTVGEKFVGSRSYWPGREA